MPESDERRVAPVPLNGSAVHADVRDMSISAVGSALSGISANQAAFDSAAARVARVETAPDDGSAGFDPTTAGRVALPPGSGELVDVVVGAMVAADGVAANTAVLRTALDMDRAVLDVLA